MADASHELRIDMGPMRLALYGLIGAQWSPMLERHLRAMFEDRAAFDLVPARPGTGYQFVAMPTVQLHRLVSEYGINGRKG